MKNKELKESLEKKLHQLVAALKLTKPSAKLKSLIKKTSKKLARQLASDLKKLEQSKKKQPAKAAKKQ